MRNNQVSLSIITINLNNAPGLLQTLNSLKETPSDLYQHIIVDGASSDDSIEIVKRFGYRPYCEGEARSYLSESDNGIYHGMNKGLQLARGSHVLFLNSGDALQSTEALYNILEDIRDYDIIYGSIAIDIGNSMRVIEPPTLSREHRVPFVELPFHPSFVCSKKLLQLVGGFDEKYRYVADVKAIEGVISRTESIKKVNYTISTFDLNGITSDRGNQSKILSERIKLETTDLTRYQKRLLSIYSPGLVSFMKMGVPSRVLLYCAQLKLMILNIRYFRQWRKD